ncbi:sigma-70 family RNA polymerase sigma factor [Kitasatospora sp. NPDC101447]|uniref:sigma-70 family RNA polymerase sigma factor n=1 Tax=Kitasatospora sp. NPDC101447 TaxID=3364102 RepID=UPI00380431AA
MSDTGTDAGAVGGAGVNPGPAGGPRTHELTQLLKKVWVKAVSDVTRMGISTADAEDIVQEAFIAVVKRWDDIQPENRVAYFMKAARNRATEYFRRTRPVPVADLPDQPGTDDPSEAVAAYDVVRRVLDDVAEHAPRTAQVVWLTYIEERSTEEIAEEMGVHPTTVRAHLAHAQEVLTASARRLGLFGAPEPASRPVLRLATAPAGDLPAGLPQGGAERIAALEAEVRRLREELIRAQGAGPSPSTGWAGGGMPPGRSRTAPGDGPEPEDSGAAAAIRRHEEMQREFLEREIAKLPPQQQRAIRLAQVGSTPVQIAEIMGITPGCARTTLCHARKRLMSTLNLTKDRLAVIMKRPSLKSVGDQDVPWRSGTAA